MLAGIHATWEFESDSVLIRFERGIRAPKLFQALRERRIPHEALESVTLTPGKRGTVVLHAVPRPGADPLMEAAAGQLKEACDPYRLVLPAERETLAEYYADELRGTPGCRDAAGPAERHLVAAPEAPLNFKAYDGKAAFDGRRVTFRWFWTGASSEKWKAGDQTFPVGGASGVEWRSPEVFDGHLRLLRREADGCRRPGRPRPGGRGLRPRLRPGARVAAVRGGGPGGRTGRRRPRHPAPGGPGRGGRRDPADIAERIRHLGELHRAGLVTDDEFTREEGGAAGGAVERGPAPRGPAPHGPGRHTP